MCIVTMYSLESRSIYATGDSYLTSTKSEETGDSTYILNENTMKFHTPDCLSVQKMNPNNRKEYTGNRQALLNQGYEPCQQCHP